MHEIEVTDGPVFVNRRGLLAALEGISDEVVVVRQAGSDDAPAGLGSADLACVGDPFTEAVKSIVPVPQRVDRSDLLVPRLPVVARTQVLRAALEASTAEVVSLAEVVAARGGAVAVVTA